MGDSLFFMYPWPHGDVYGVTGEIFDHSMLVILPDGKRIRVEVEEGMFPIANLVSNLYPPESDGRVLEAELVFRWGEAVREFADNWAELIRLINAAAAVNTLFCVILTPAEYQRLENGAFEREIRPRLSPRAQELAFLGNPSRIYFEEERPALDLFRTGRCP